MKKYVGTRLSDGAQVAVVDLTTHCAQSLDAGFRFVNHSPTGFEWGYGGSGPAQLSFAILLDYFGNPDEARKFYQFFKWHVIANLSGNSWELDEKEIERAIAEIRELAKKAGGEESWASTT
jgi:Family of unknown function (DUF6166)